MWNYRGRRCDNINKRYISMIKAIKINNFGSLIDFTNDQCKFSSGKTVIHGMNGSGKSQICSIFRQVEKLRKIQKLAPEKIKDEEKGILNYFRTRISKEALSDIISINIDNYSALFNTDKITQNGNIPDLFVFNDDYVNDNIGDYLNIHDREIRIGQQNVERDKLIIEKQNKEEALKKVNEEIEKLVKKAKDDSGYSKQERTSKIINKENYLKINNPEEAYPNGKKELDELSNPPEQLTDHKKYSFPSLSLDKETKDSINKIMLNPYLEPKLTQEFYKSYLKIKKSFYEDGVSLFNETKNICPFCLSSKKEDDSTINELINYINSDYNEKLKYIQNTKEAFEQKRKTLQIFISNWNGLIPNIKDKLKLLQITDDIDNIILDDNIFDKCISLLKTKIENMDKEIKKEELIPFTDYENYLNNINGIYLEHLDKIEKLNNKIDNLKSLKQSIGEKIIKNEMFLLWNNKTLRERHEELTKEIDILNKKIEESSNSVSNNSIPGFFNIIIRILGLAKYELNKDSLLFLKLDNNFDISQEGFRISAGERKIIAFSYFLAEVLASANSNAELLQKTIIIDDPVDSSDYDKFYSFISVIEKFDDILAKIFDNHEIKLGQIIIFTHSALLYERLINTKEIDFKQITLENNKSTMSKPKRKIGLATFSSYIKKITNYIKNIECKNTKDIGNYIRRVLEIISSVENIGDNKITNINVSPKLNALVNHLSHESIERILDPLPASCEYIEACIELIEIIETRIPILYNTIVENYLDNNKIEYYRAEYNKKFLGI
jgi:hypothetical protein